MEVNKQIRDMEAGVVVIEERHIDNEMHAASECALLERDGKLPTHSSTPDFLNILNDLLADTDMNISDGSVKESHQWRTERFSPPPPTPLEQHTPKSLADDVLRALLYVVASATS